MLPQFPYPKPSNNCIFLWSFPWIRDCVVLSFIWSRIQLGLSDRKAGIILKILLSF
jgi:hypothetical protein